MKKEGCGFCEYTEKEVIIYDDELCYAVISKEPINKYHVLVIPKEHYENFVELPDELASHIFLVAKKLSAAVRKAASSDAVTHISDDDISKSGYNLVGHYKFHIIPRFNSTEDKLQVRWNREPDPGLEARAKFATEVRGNL